MLNIVYNQTTDYCIAIPDKPSIVEETAAEELALYIFKSCKVKLPIQKESEVSGNVLYVGHTEFAKKNGLTGKSVENWMICACGEDVVLTGGLTNMNRGIPYAVCHFLEDIAGIRWWSWFEEYVPEAEALTVPRNFNKSGTPVFDHRNIADSFEKLDLAYVVRNRLNAWCDDVLEEGPAHPDFVSRGGVKYIGLPAGNHTMPILVPIDEYYNEHPEWFAYNELSKSRPKTDMHGTLYCLTNEELISFVAKKVVGYIDENARIADEKGLEMPCFFSVSAADSSGSCQCEKCKQVNEKSGKTGYNLKFVNAVADLVAKERPDTLIETLVYMDYIEPPKDNTVPSKNVLIHLADIKVDLLRDIESPTNKEEKRLLDSWSELCEKNNTTLHIWDYYLNQYPNCMMPYFLKLPRNFRYFHQKNATGCFVEHEPPHISDFWTMTQWLLTRVLEDPYQDFDVLVEDFTSRYYGAASPYIKEYISLLEENLSENACRIMVFEQANIGNYVSYKTIRDGMEILCKAEESVKADKLRMQRVHTVMSCLYRTLVLRYEEFEIIAKKHNEVLQMSKQRAAELVISYLEENAHVYTKEVDGKMLNEEVYTAVKREIAFMQRYLKKVNPEIAIPDELLQYGAENIYTFAGTAFYGLAGCGMLPDGHQTGESIEWSDEVGHDVLKISPRQMPVRRMYQHLAGKRNDDYPNPLEFFTDGYGENAELKLFQEDLVKEAYHLYNIGTISGVSADSATMLRIFHYLGYCLGISNLYEVFPADTYSIYIHFKVSGAGYGGNEDAEDAFYLDAIHVVRH